MQTINIVEQATDATTSQTDATDQLRAQLHRMWAEVAGGWAAHADCVDQRSARMTQRMWEYVPDPCHRFIA